MVGFWCVSAPCPRCLGCLGFARSLHGTCCERGSPKVNSTLEGCWDSAEPPPEEPRTALQRAVLALQEHLRLWAIVVHFHSITHKLAKTGPGPQWARHSWL